MRMPPWPLWVPSRPPSTCLLGHGYGKVGGVGFLIFTSFVICLWRRDNKITANLKGWIPPRLIKITWLQMGKLRPDNAL